MSQPLRVILATGDGQRHRYAASMLGAHTQLLGVVSEAKRPVTPAADGPDDAVVLPRHWAERTEAEQRLFGGSVAFPEVPRLSVPAGGINTPDADRWIAERHPDVVVLFGTSIVKPPLLDRYAGRMVNVHLGLSPYYRGSGTNFWPLTERRPECVGATIHLAVAEVDAGAILTQVRPEAAPSDRAHDLGTKTIIGAFRVLPGVIAAFMAGDVKPKPQPAGEGRVFRRRDFNAAAVRQMWNHFASGMMPEYLRDGDRRRAAYPIVEPAV